VFIASKLEEMKPIKIQKLKEEAGHNKFKYKSIREKEVDLIKTLDCKLYTETPYESSMRYIKSHLHNIKLRLPSVDEEILFKFL
jgi:hypothetical protein